MSQKVLILAVFCSLSIHATPTGNIDLGSVISPIFTAKTGLLSAAQKGVNSHFDQKTNRLESLSSSLSGGLGGGASGGFNPLTIIHTLLKSIIPGSGSSSGGLSAKPETSSFDFENDNSFDNGGSTYQSGGYEAASGHSQAQQYSSDSGYVYQQPPPPSNGGYVYERPAPHPSTGGLSTGGGVSTGGNIVGVETNGGSSGSHGSSGGLGGLGGIIGSIGQIPVQLLTTSKDRINTHFDKKIAHLNKFSGSFSNTH